VRTLRVYHDENNGTAVVSFSSQAARALHGTADKVARSAFCGFVCFFVGIAVSTGITNDGTSLGVGHATATGAEDAVGGKDEKLVKRSKRPAENVGGGNNGAGDGFFDTRVSEGACDAEAAGEDPAHDLTFVVDKAAEEEMALVDMEDGAAAAFDTGALAGVGGTMVACKLVRAIVGEKNGAAVASVGEPHVLVEDEAHKGGGARGVAGGEEVFVGAAKGADKRALHIVSPRPVPGGEHTQQVLLQEEGAV